MPSLTQRRCPLAAFSWVVFPISLTLIIRQPCHAFCDAGHQIVLSPRRLVFDSPYHALPSLHAALGPSRKRPPASLCIGAKGRLPGAFGLLTLHTNRPGCFSRWGLIPFATQKLAPALTCWGFFCRCEAMRRGGSRRILRSCSNLEQTGKQREGRHLAAL
jgi:hypothetical protein